MYFLCQIGSSHPQRLPTKQPPNAHPSTKQPPKLKKFLEAQEKPQPLHHQKQQQQQQFQHQLPQKLEQLQEQRQQQLDTSLVTLSCP